MSGRINKIQTNYGSIVVVDAIHSDEESTECTMNHKQIQEAQPVIEAQVSLPMEEDIWWQMNQDFARDADHEEFYVPIKKNVKKVQKAAASAPMLSDDEWMEINQDFARDSHMEVGNHRDDSIRIDPIHRETA